MKQHSRHNAYPSKPEARLTEKLRPDGAWQKERATRLHRQFKRVDNARQSGKSVKAALSQFQRYWRNETYRTEPARRVRFSFPTLVRLYYRWCNNGRTPRALSLHFKPITGSPIKQQDVLLFVRSATALEVCTFAAAYARLERPAFSASQLWRVLPEELRQELRLVFYARRRQRTIEINLSRFLTEGGWQ